MAVLQKQIPRSFERPAARPIKLPATHRRYRTYNRAFERARRYSLAAGATAALLLVLYIGGYARMTAVNYQRVQILSQNRGILAQNDLLEAEILRRTDKAAVAHWAKTHNMVMDSNAALVLHP